MLSAPTSKGIRRMFWRKLNRKFTIMRLDRLLWGRIILTTHDDGDIGDTGIVF